MKKLIGIALIAIFAGFSAGAQVKTEVKKDVRKVGNKTAEVGSKAKAKITDKTYADKVGPDGQTIYINKHSKYYWIDDKGHKRFVTKAQMKNK